MTDRFICTSMGCIFLTPVTNTSNLSAMTDLFRVGCRNYSGTLGLYFNGSMGPLRVSTDACPTSNFIIPERPFTEPPMKKFSIESGSTQLPVR